MIKVKTIYTKENFLEFQKYHFFHKSKARIGFTIFGLLFLLLGILGVLDQDYVFGITELVFGTVLLIEFNTSIVPRLQAKYLLKSDSMLIGLENEITFYEDHIEAVNKRSTSNIFYNEIYTYAESKDYFYIYLNRVSAFLVEKEEHAEQIRKLLEENIKRK